MSSIADRRTITHHARIRCCCRSSRLKWDDRNIWIQSLEHNDVALSLVERLLRSLYVVVINWKYPRSDFTVEGVVVQTVTCKLAFVIDDKDRLILMRVRRTIGELNGRVTIDLNAIFDPSGEPSFQLNQQERRQRLKSIFFEGGATAHCALVLATIV